MKRRKEKEIQGVLQLTSGDNLNRKIKMFYLSSLFNIEIAHVLEINRVICNSN